MEEWGEDGEKKKGMQAISWPLCRCLGGRLVGGSAANLLARRVWHRWLPARFPTYQPPVPSLPSLPHTHIRSLFASRVWRTTSSST